jgi:hypothetical protein
MTFKYLESRLNKLPKTEWGDLVNDTFERLAPIVKVWTNEEGEQVVCLSSEQGNMSCFEYLGDSDYMVDLVPELHSWAKQYGWEWQCHYQGTYFLYKA